MFWLPANNSYQGCMSIIVNVPGLIDWRGRGFSTVGLGAGKYSAVGRKR